MEKHEHCNCEECRDDGLSCGCAACARKKSVEKGEGFFSKHGAELIKIGVSLILLIIAALTENNVAKLVLCIVSYVISAYEIAINCVKGIIRKEFLDENTLMFIASITAFCLGDYTEGVFVLVLYAIGELLEEVATENSRKKITSLSELKNVTARVITKAGFAEIPPEEVEVGALLEIRRGDRIPIDGILLGAGATLDVKAITGESSPCYVSDGECVYAGSVNIGDAIVIKTTKLYKDSTVEKIISMVEGANAKKAKSQKFITSFAKIYTPSVVAAAVLVAFIPPLFDGFNFVKWIYKALSFLVISCPCALVISVPLAFFTGIGSLAKRGILVKGSNCVDALSQVKTVAFDKTGTLTKGEFSLEKTTAYGDFTEQEIINYAAAVESASNHPLSSAILSCATEGFAVAVNVKEFAGKGLCGDVNGKKVLIGNDKLMADNGIEALDERYYGTIIFVAIDGKFAGKLYLCDRIKPEAEIAIENLRNRGIKKAVMFSGDNAAVCEKVGKKIGLDAVYSQLLPEEKAEELKKIKSNGDGKVMFVGDGINDAPTIALADVGVAMGALGSEIAIESADVVIMDDDVRKIAIAVKKAKTVKRKVLENIVGSLAIKAAVMALGIFISLPVWIAMLADVGVMIAAVINSLTVGR